MNEKTGGWDELARGVFALRGGAARGLVLRDPTLVQMLALSDWWKFVIETLLMMASLAAVRELVFDGSASTGGMPHPYWIPVALISAQYGVLGGLFATIVATAAYFVEDAPSESMALDFYAYAGAVAAQPAAWLGTALILGGLRSLHIRRVRDLEEQLANSVNLGDGLAAALENALTEIRKLERHIAVSANSAAAISRSLARLDTTHRRAAAASFADLVRHSVGATSFAIYLRERSGFEPVSVVSGGRILPVSGAPLLEGALVGALSRTNAVLDGMQDCPATGERAPIIAAMARRGLDGEALGVVVCQSSGLSGSATEARSRLAHLVQAFAAVLSACKDADCGTQDND